MAAFGKINAPSLKEICVQEILTKILAGELKPGDRLPAERELAEAIRGKGAFRRFKTTIRFYGVEQRWYDFLADAYKAIAIQWCKDNQLEYTIDTEN